MSDKPFMTITLTAAEHDALAGAIGTVSVVWRQTMDAGVGRPEKWEAEMRVLAGVLGKLGDHRSLVVNGDPL